MCAALSHHKACRFARSQTVEDDGLRQPPYLDFRITQAIVPSAATRSSVPSVTEPPAQGRAAMNPNKALWEKGDFTQIASFMRESGDALVKSLKVAPPMRALDLGCGD